MDIDIDNVGHAIVDWSVVSSMDNPTNTTLYIQNLDTKISKDGASTTF